MRSSSTYLSTSPIHHSLSNGHCLMATMATHQLCKALRDCCVKRYTSSLAGLETNQRTTAPQQQCYNNNISSTDYNVLVFVWMHPNQTAWCTVLLLWCPLQGFKWFCSPLIHIIYTRFLLPHVYPRSFLHCVPFTRLHVSRTPHGFYGLPYSRASVATQWGMPACQGRKAVKCERAGLYWKELFESLD